VSAATARWAYDTGAKRDLRIDFLRGAAMVGMIVDHTGGDSSWLYVLTGGNRFFVSAAGRPSRLLQPEPSGIWRLGHNARISRPKT
jgi:hypothetical protein